MNCLKQSPSKEGMEWDSFCRSDMSARPLYKQGRMPREALHSNSWNTKDLQQAAGTFKKVYTISLLREVIFLINKLSWKSASLPYLYHIHTLNRKHYMVTPLWSKVQQPPREIWFALQLHSNLKLITDNPSYSHIRLLASEDSHRLNCTVSEYK